MRNDVYTHHSLDGELSIRPDSSSGPFFYASNSDAILRAQPLPKASQVFRSVIIERYGQLPGSFPHIIVWGILQAQGEIVHRYCPFSARMLAA